MIVKQKLKNGTIKNYSYEKIGNQPVSAYMYEKQKQRRQKARQKNGKLLFEEIPESKLTELRTCRRNGVSYSKLARDSGLSVYFVQKAALSSS